MTKRPNILWYCTDQQRWDTIRRLGNPHINTPRLDAFCEGGVAFNNAYCQSPICTPSRASMMTGRYPASTHVHRNGNAHFPAGETVVTKLLADAGYDCGLIGKFHLSAAKGHEKRFDDGYRLWAWSHHPKPDLDVEHHAYHRWLVEEKGVDPHALHASIEPFCGAGMPEELHQTTWITERAISFINEERDGPWMLSLNPFDPHPPFDPPKEYLDRYDPEKMPPAAFRPHDIERQKAFVGITQQTPEAIDPTGPMPKVELSAEERLTTGYKPPKQYNDRIVKAAYYAMIELIDTQFGRLIDALEANGQLDNTIIIFHSDHGETLGDHGLLYKGCRFFESLVHVPMIWSWRGRTLTDVQSDALVENVDIAPTLLEAADLPVPANMQGRSLWPLLTGKAAPDHHKDYVISEFNDALGSATGEGPSHGSMYFDGRYKHILYQGTGLGELYDLETDPDEFDNRFNDPALVDLRLELMHKHSDALLASSDAGVERVSIY